MMWLPKATLSALSSNHPENAMVSQDTVSTEGQTVVPLRGVRAMIADKMVSSLREGAQLTHHGTCDVSALLRVKERMANKGVRLSVEDLVNHCVNDIAVCGARPLFFLDYLAAGTIVPDVVEAIVKGFAVACSANGCALIGGETAEMPDLYRAGEYDLAGTIVGIVERDGIVDGAAIQEGDLLIGLPSSGLHTNGYSLARHVLFDRFVAGDTPDLLGGQTIGEVLLRIHKSYLDSIQALIAENLATGFSHVTGGGLVGNTNRILPDGLALDVAWDAWRRPPIFRLIQDVGQVPEDDMRRTFNLGVGLVVVVPEANKARALAVLGALGEPAIEIGRVVQAD